MISRLPITHAATALDALVKRIRRGNKEYFIVEKNGIPVAGGSVMDLDEFEDYLELQDPKVREQIRKSNEEYLAGKSRPAEELLGELRDAERRSTKRRPKR